MSSLSDEYSKNFSSEKKAEFNRRFSEDYDAGMSERSNIIRILGEMRELGLADGGRIGYADGTPDKTSLLDMLDVQASGSKTGKNQITGAPDGITIDSESINAIIKADIPISQKIDLIAEYKYGKNRDRVDDKGKEIFLSEGGYKDQDIGFGYNQGGEGISGSVMRDLRTGDDEFKIKLSKKFADGGRIGLKEGLGSFETNDPEEAIKEIIKRVVNVEGATVPISENISLNLGPSVDQAELGGIIKLLGGDLMFGGGFKGDDKGIGISFKKEFNKGGLARMLGE